MGGLTIRTMNGWACPHETSNDVFLNSENETSNYVFLN